MRFVLALILIGHVCHLKGNPTTTTAIDENTRNYRQNCANSCNASKDLQDRMRDRNYKDTVEDKCFMVCVCKFFKLIGEDGKLKSTTLESNFQSLGLSKPQDMHLITDLSETDTDFTIRTANFAAKNKQLLTDYHNLVTGTATKSADTK